MWECVSSISQRQEHNSSGSSWNCGARERLYVYVCVSVFYNRWLTLNTYFKNAFFLFYSKSGFSRFPPSPNNPGMEMHPLPRSVLFRMWGRKWANFSDFDPWTDYFLTHNEARERTCEQNRCWESALSQASAVVWSPLARFYSNDENKILHHFHPGCVSHFVEKKKVVTKSQFLFLKCHL